MGMYTEFYFRADLKDSPAAQWLDEQINGPGDFQEPFGADHDFFACARWTGVFIGGGAVYQESRKPIFRRGRPDGWPRRHQLVLASSLKNYNDEIEHFVDWITPHLDMYDGEFLGYALYEGSDEGDYTPEFRDHPKLFFYNREAVWQ